MAVKKYTKMYIHITTRVLLHKILIFTSSDIFIKSSLITMALYHHVLRKTNILYWPVTTLKLKNFMIIYFLAFVSIFDR